MLPQYTTTKAENMMMQDMARFRSPSTRKLMIGLAIRISRKISKIKTHHEQDQEGLHSPERVAKPVPFLSLAEHDFPAGHDQHQQPQADVVEVQRLATQLGPLLLEIVGVIDHGVRGDQRQERRSGR